jgi:NAD(P)-dependent dehydrogenase (short-subunit alcohol dehydrogenase family)
MLLHGTRAVVTGAGNAEDAPGVGACIALELAAHGAHVLCVTRSDENCSRLAEKIRAKGGASDACAADVSTAAGCARVAAAAAGDVDILVNVVHDASRTGLAKADDESWDRAIATNCSSLLRLARACDSQLRAGAVVLNVGTIWSHRALVVDGRLGQRHAYAAGKAGAAALVRTLAAEWAPRGIRVNQLTLGFLRSPLVDRAISRSESDGQVVHKARDAMTLQGRQATPEDAARCALALVSPLTGLVNGQDICADGGTTAVSGTVFPGRVTERGMSYGF